MVTASFTSLEGRVAIVTGGARGIGAAISSMLAQDGAIVAVVGLPDDGPRAESLKSNLNGASPRVFFYEGDVGDYAACERVVEQVVAAHGRIDILVNNAGITADRTVRKMSIEEWNRVLRVNLSGPFHMTKAVLEQMIGQGYGRIVNISSVVGLHGNVGQANYASAKAGLLGLTKTVALETAQRGITVNAVAPGFINTEMVAQMPAAAIEGAVNSTPQHRLGEPHEIARVVRYLVDEGSGYTTGAVFNVNGGWYM